MAERQPAEIVLWGRRGTRWVEAAVKNADRNNGGVADS